MEQDINGWKMKSLLNKNLLQFIGCLLILLVLATPLFYFLTKNYYAEEIIELIDNVKKGNMISSSDLGEDILTGLMLQFILIFTVISLSLLLVMRFLTRKLWKPFDETLNKIEQFNLDSSDIPHFVKSDIIEFARLNNSVEKFMRKNKEKYISQKEFTENASHELQTPIAIINSKLELLLQEDLNQQQTHIISDMYQISTRMSHLNKNLLLLAKIENSQFQSFENINLNLFIQQKLSVYSGLHNNIIPFINNFQVIINANRILLESLFDNLIVNAIRNTPQNGSIRITLEKDTLLIENNSCGTMLDQKKIFQRFCHSSENKKGNGLGLAIVKAICDYHGWIIKYAFNNNNHTFIINFTNNLVS